MKKLLLFAFAVFAFAACTQNDVEELSANRQDVPETLTVGFEGSDDTRIQLNEAQKTVWNAGDEVSVFYKSYDNLKFQFQGETGARSGMLKKIDGSFTGQTMGEIIVVYPYSTDYLISHSPKAVITSFPSVQSYKKGSYGKYGNIMVAASEFSAFTLKNVCGWLRVDITGDGEKVQHIKFRGNNDEQIAGLVYIDADSAEITFPGEVGGYDDVENSVGGGLMFEDSIFTEITLSCGDGVALGSAAKSFYIGLLPQTFEKGITVEVECDNGTSITKSTSEPITIERNHIKPMEAIEYDGVLPEVYELAYRTNDGKALDPFTTKGFGGEFEENIFDAATGEGKLVFAGAITTIPNQAFGLCENLTWIEIPLGVTSIGASAFSGCSSMEEIIIPASVTSVGSEVFKGCTGKAYINCSGVSFSGTGFAEVVIGDSVTTIGDSAFRDCDSLTSVTIPDSVTTIGNGAFSNCDSLTSVTIGDSVTTIGEDAFNSCYSLTSVTIGDSVTTIGDSAFQHCDSLTSITIPDSVTTIGDYAFYYCDSLTSVTIPDSVTTIGDYAFYHCDSLTSVYCEATTPPSLGNNAFKYYGNGDSVNIGCAIYVPAESVEAYKSAAGWSEYTDAIVGYDFETGEITKPSINLGVCGTFTNWGGILDIEMEYLEDRNLYVAYGIELTTDDCFKLRSNNEWNGRYNIGASYYGYVAYPNSLTEVINNPNSLDIFVAESGTYDIYINLDTMELYFMVEGTYPYTISDMENVE